MGVAGLAPVFGYGTLAGDDVDLSTGGVEVPGPRQGQRQNSPNVRVYGAALAALRALKAEARQRLGFPAGVLTDEVLIGAMIRVVASRPEVLDAAVAEELLERLGQQGPA